MKSVTNIIICRHWYANPENSPRRRQTTGDLPRTPADIWPHLANQMSDLLPQPPAPISHKAASKADLVQLLWVHWVGFISLRVLFSCLFVLQRWFPHMLAFIGYSNFCKKREWHTNIVVKQGVNTRLASIICAICRRPKTHKCVLIRHINVFIICRRNASFLCFY